MGREVHDTQTTDSTLQMTENGKVVIHGIDLSGRQLGGVRGFGGCTFYGIIELSMLKAGALY
jgi:hypothetical protein